MKIFTPCAHGLEHVVGEELRALGATVDREEAGGVHATGDESIHYRAAIELRAASRVLLPLTEIAAPDADALYETARDSIDWQRYVSAGHTFAIDCTRRLDAKISHTHFAALRLKDAICDRLRKETGTRPNVDTEAPDVRFSAHLVHDRCLLSLDVNGGPLHKRGYRAYEHVAPLRETLAAGILLLTGWTGETPLFDPMCGSGTLLLEGALIATKTAPGLIRTPIGAMRWPGANRELYDKLIADAKARVRPLPSTLHGADIDKNALRAVEFAARRLNLPIRVQRCDVREMRPPTEAPGHLVTNPPYGDRLGEIEEAEVLHAALGSALKHHFPGWIAHVMVGDASLIKQIALHASRKIPLWNGPIECRLVRYEMYAGTRKRA